MLKTIAAKRTPVCEVDSDSGYLCVSNLHAFPDAVVLPELPSMTMLAKDWLLLGPLAAGPYPLLTLSDLSGKRLGFEIVFTSPAIDLLVEAELIRQGAPRLSAEEWMTYYNGSAMKATADKAAIYNEILTKYKDSTWYDNLMLVDPFDEGKCQLQHTLAVSEALAVGDPSYGQASYCLDLPPAEYQVVTFHAFEGTTKILTRLGVYQKQL